jgi:hypothetical protein
LPQKKPFRAVAFAAIAWLAYRLKVIKVVWITTIGKRYAVVYCSSFTTTIDA